jgi:hypothetical protein
MFCRPGKADRRVRPSADVTELTAYVRDYRSGTGFIISNLLGIILASLAGFLGFGAVFFKHAVKLVRKNKKEFFVTPALVVFAGAVITDEKGSLFSGRRPAVPCFPQRPEKPARAELPY